MANSTAAGTVVVQPAKTQMIKSDRRMFSASDDSAMMRQIQATHSPDGREVDVKPILRVIEEILHRASPGIDSVIKDTQDHYTLEDKTIEDGLEEILDALAYIIHKISCELACKCSSGADAHTTTMAIFNVLSNYSWETKVVISLAAFSANYGEFWLVAQLCTTHPLAKSVALLKQMPDIIEHSSSLKTRFDAINNLIRATLDVTKCIVEFRELPSQYISSDTPPMSVAMTHIPTAAYWTIRSMVACASQITSLLGMSYEHITSATEAWELSGLAHKISNIYEHLKEQLRICYYHIEEKRDMETYKMIVRLFEMTHLDNIRILKALIYPKDDISPLVDGSTKTRVNIEVLRRKTVLLLISDLDLPHEELMLLAQFHQEIRLRSDLHYEIVWIPIVDRSTPWNEQKQNKLEQLQLMMPWYMVHHPSILEPAVIRYIKEVWHFTKKLILVVLDPQGKVVSPNALYMIWIWGNLAYPFTLSREESLWKEETWRLELLVDGIDALILDWIANKKFICLYGGEDIEWIRKFTSTAKAVALEAGIALELVYVGKSNARERLKKVTNIITAEKLSHFWPEVSSNWYFWTRLESMLYSKVQHRKSLGNEGILQDVLATDRVMQEVLTMLSFDGSEQGWAIIGQGLDPHDMAKAKGETMLTSFQQFETWREDAKERGFVAALIEKLHKLHTPEHCNRLILPGINGGIPERVVCAECGRPMEKYFMYRCCTD